MRATSRRPLLSLGQKSRKNDRPEIRHFTTRFSCGLRQACEELHGVAAALLVSAAFRPRTPARQRHAAHPRQTSSDALLDPACLFIGKRLSAIGHTASVWHAFVVQDRTRHGGKCGNYGNLGNVSSITCRGLQSRIPSESHSLRHNTHS